MAQTTLITDLVSLVTPNNNDVFVVVDNTSDPSLSVTKKISYADLKESLQDMIDTMVTEGTGINASYSDVANTLTLSVVADTTLQKGIISSGGTEIGQRQEINFIPGASVTLSGADNANDNRVDLTINTTAVSTSVNATVSGTSYNVLSSINTLGDGTKELEFRPIKAASTKAVVNYGDSDNSITIDVNPGAIPITDLDTSAPLPVNLGGTGGNTAALARGGIGAAKAGANSDITSLSALTTPLSIAQGGTGGNTTQDALENLQGLKFVESVGIAGESIVATNSKVVGGEYRAEIKGLQAGSNKLQLTSTNNDITLDIDADNVLGAASQNVDLNGYRLTNIGAPIGTSDAATKDYVDSRSQGFAVKASAVAATTASLSGTYNGGPDFTFTLAPTGTPTIDTVNITATGTRVLFKDQTNGYENGIYELTTSGDFGVNAVFTRTEDYDSDAEILAGTIVFIESGSTNIGKQFIQITSEPTIDADPLEFAVLSDTIIPQGSVTNVKLDNMDALRVKGTLTAGVPQDLTPDNVIEIVNSGTTEIDEPRLPKATTSATGLTRLYDDVDSVSSSRAATANAVKTAYDAAISASGDAATAQSAANAAQATADAALPVSGGTMTGLINFAVGQDFPGEVEASGSTLTDGVYVNPTLTGITSAPTQAVGTSDNQIATTAFVNAEIANDAPTKTGSGASGTWGINVTGNAGTATKLATPRTINLGGDLSGSAAFDGSGNITLSGTVVNNSVALGANTTGSYVANATTSGNGIGGSVNTEGGTFTVTSNATSAGTANTIVFRNSSGNFSANLITASLNGNASTATKLATARTIALTGDISGSASFDGSSNISISTAIGDNALALGTNTTGNYVAVGATSGNGISGSSSSEGGTFTVTSNATSANTAGTIVYRDGNGNFNAGTITASLNGNASSASELATARTISLTGDVTGSVSFDGSASVNLATTIVNNSITLGTDTTGNYVAAGATSGNGISGSVNSEGGTFTVTSNATSSNTGGTIVYRDGSGNFSAGTISAALDGNASTASSLASARTISLTGDVTGSVSFDGSSNVNLATTIANDSVALGTDTTGSYVATGATSGNGISGSVDSEGGTFTVTSNATSANTAGTIVFRDGNGNFSAGTISAALDGNAATASSLASARTISLTGDVTGSVSFDGSASVDLAATIANDSVALGTDTTGSYVAAGATSGNGISGSVDSEGGTFTVTSNATSVNTANTIVFRDGNGNFNAGTITGSLSGNASTASSLADARTISLSGSVTGSVNFDGSANVDISTSMTTPINIPPSATNNSDIFFRGSSNRPAARINCFYNSAVDAGSLSFYALKPGETEPTRRYRLTYIGTHEFHTDQVNALVALTAQPPSNTEFVFSGAHSAASITSSRTSTSAIASNGSFFSATGVYATVASDIAAKENVEDANSQWNDVKSLRVVNFNFKEDWMPGITERQIGFIAQEVETVCPGLVVDAKFNGNEGKTIKTSIIHIKAFKALQEAMERIETLEATNEALMANLQVLEARLEALEAQ